MLAEGSCGGRHRPAFTPREWDVIRSYASGQTWTATVADMGISRSTLSEHWASIMRKTPEAAGHIDVLRVIGWLNVPDIKVDAA